jgi:hypothetical protein
VTLSKPRFCQHGRHPKIGRTNVGAILHHSAHVTKQKTLKILSVFCVICVEDYYKLTQTQFLIQSPLGNLTSHMQKRETGVLRGLGTRLLTSVLTQDVAY